MMFEIMSGRRMADAFKTTSRGHRTSSLGTQALSLCHNSSARQRQIQPTLFLLLTAICSCLAAVSKHRRFVIARGGLFNTNEHCIFPHARIRRASTASNNQYMRPRSERL